MDPIINYSELRFVRAIGWNARELSVGYKILSESEETRRKPTFQ